MLPARKGSENSSTAPYPKPRFFADILKMVSRFASNIAGISLSGATEELSFAGVIFAILSAASGLAGRRAG